LYNILDIDRIVLNQFLDLQTLEPYTTPYFHSNEKNQRQQKMSEQIVIFHKIKLLG
jgi:hypothetical protein